MDGYSHYVWTIPLTYKSEVNNELKNLLKLLENQSERKVKRIVSDNGGELVNKDRKEY